ncbi:MAG: alpha/beta hydrolase [Planctomycetes bacterium]|nr:alpha/beta hydrolase [Planctomycetota bacterium]MCH9724909.1 alpha/beta hydrolase [Planctomycetota bacterium]MCH9776868.1 alpha/beta hydrolase [Planctomycetota bacterium]MCH9790372.1 alpha/beta hydrolase [Planctomycetota bacterium]
MRSVCLAVYLLCSLAVAPIETPEPDERIAVWPDRPLLEKSDDEVEYKNIIRINKVTRPAIEFYKSKTAKANAPAVVIFPGGGYNILAYDLEGTEVAEWLNSIGVHAVVVKYTVPGNQREAALKDAQRAFGIVRSKAKEWGINPEQIGVLGFSAGGHLAANLSTNYQKRNYESIDAADKLSCRPDFSVLIYPAYIYDAKDKRKMAPEIKVDAKTPPAFIVQTLDDRRLVDSAFNYTRALKDAKVDGELHLYARGGHGYGLRPSDNPISGWPKLCGEWLKRTTQK